MEDEIRQILETEVAPALARHAGAVEFVAFSKETGVLSLRLLGSCRGCPLSDMTLKMGIESLLQERIPAVREVISVE